MIRNTGILSLINRRHENWNGNLEEKRYYSNKKLDDANILMQLTNVVVQSALLLLCAWLVLRENLTVSQYVLFITMENNIFAPLCEIAENITRYRSSAAVREKIFAIVDADIADTLPCAEAMTHEICFENVSFGYEEGRSILNGLSLTFEKGKKYAIVGESGSGKSTVLRLLLRYYDSYTGAIRMDGKEIRTLSPDSVRSHCSLIPQNVFLFEDTFYNNLTLYREYGEDEVWNAIKRAGLETVVSRLENGKETPVSENGNNFSGGEKQRIAMARAMLLKNNLVLMDEATANVDIATAAGVERILLEDDSLTCISIMHHFMPENMLLYDKIFVLKDGIVAEQGTYAQLMEQNGLFVKLQKAG